MKIGIDVSKSSFDAHWGEGDRQRHHCFDYTQRGIEEFIEQLPPGAHAVMEASGVYHSRLAVRLYEAGVKVSVVNPVVIKRFGQMLLKRVKSDKADSQLILAYAETHDPPLWEPSSEAINDLKQALSLADDLVREQTMVSNRQEALLHHAQPSAFVQRELKLLRKHLRMRLERCDRHLRVVVKKHFPELYDRLQTIPSVGEKTAVEMIVITEGFEKFDTDKSLAAYVGISPTTYSSGSSIKGRGGIARTGQARARQLLYMCSWSARYANPACKALYERLRAAGKPPKVISVAIAHKLLRQIFAVAKSGQRYRPECANCS